MAGVASRVLGLLEIAVENGTKLGLRVAWAGGGVRDLFLGRSQPDLDLVVDGEIQPLALALGEALDGSTILHDRFETASIRSARGKIDLARSRRESYPEPGALPVVAPAPILEDLHRRDFSINAMAIDFPRGSLRDPNLLDPCHGLRDLRAGELRVLHSRSFDDDPTRILRGLGFELRFGFRLEPVTEGLARDAIARGRLELLSPERLWRGLQRALEHPGRVADLLARLDELGAIGHLLPTGLDLEATVSRTRELACGDLEPTPESAADLLLVALGLALPREQRAALRRKLLLSRLQAQRLVEGPERIDAAVRILRSAPAPHRVAESLERLAPVEIVAAAVLGGEAAVAWIARWRLELRHRESSVAPADLLAAGVPEGPRMGAALRAARRARIDRDVAPDEELAVALAAARVAPE